MAVEIPYRRQLEFEYGQVATIAPGIRRVIANNPGPFTFHGTGTYILGTGKVAVVDPGPDDQAHIDAILGALEGETISHILVTHTHMDHSPGCRKLQAVCDAPTYAYGPHGAGRAPLTAASGQSIISSVMSRSSANASARNASSSEKRSARSSSMASFGILVEVVGGPRRKIKFEKEKASS